jgi:SAM-dependent methyltransferase
MDAKLQRRVQRYGWDKAAAHYEQGWRAQLEPAQSKLLSLAGLRPGQHVLDVACGTGLVAMRAAASVGATGEVVGTDLSGEMIELARTRARVAAAGNVRFERGDAQVLEFADASFDAVLCALGLMYVPGPEAAIAEFRRVLRPGGRAVTAVWGERNRCGWAQIFPIVDARVSSEVCPMFFRLGSGTALQQAFVAGGFVDVTVERLQVVLDYPDAAAACRAAFAGGPVALAYARFPDAVRDQAQDEYLASIAAYRNANGYSIPGEFVIAAGTRAGDEFA